MANPLTESDLNKINDSLRRLDEADEMIRRAKTAGLDMASQEQQSRENRDRLQKLKQAFFPGR
jgi:hypothetical protein